MIQKITNLNLRPKTLRQSENKQQYKAGLSPNLKSGYDSFERSMAPAFTGKTNIKTYENVLSSLDANLNRVKNSLSEYAAENLPEKTWKRVLVAVGSLGLSEGIAHLSAKIRINKETGEILESMRQNQDTQRSIINSDISDTNASTDWTLERMELEANYALAMDKIKREQIVPLFIAPVFNKTEVPNCLMISCGTENINKELIEWTKAESPCEIVTLNDDDDIVEALEKAEEHYQQTGERTLMHIRNFDTLINPKTSDDETIGAMKSIMGDCSEAFHTTILFSSQNPDELDRIATASHRVRRVEGNLKTMEEQLRDIAFNSIKNLEYPNESEWYDRKTHKPIPAEKFQRLIQGAGLYNEIPAIGKEFSINDLIKIKTKLADVVPKVVKSKIENMERPHEIITTPAKFYIKSKDGTIKEYNGYKHNVKFLINETEAWKNKSYDWVPRDIRKMNFTIVEANLRDVKQSYFSLNKDFDIPVYVAWANLFNSKAVYNETSPVLYHPSSVSRSSLVRSYIYNYGTTYNSNNYTSPSFMKMFLKITDEIFNENKDKYKTGIPEINFNTDVHNSPFSFRSKLIPGDYTLADSISYDNKTDYKKYYTEDLMNFGRHDSLLLNYVIMNYVLDKRALPDGANILQLAFDCNIFPVDEESDSKIYERSADEQQRMAKDKSLLNIVSAESKDEAERIFALDQLKDKKWCVENPVAALKKVLYVSGFDKEAAELGDEPTGDEMSAAMRKVRDNLIKIAIEDMESFDYVKQYLAYYHGLENDYPSGQVACFNDIQGLILIANEHIADKKNAKGKSDVDLRVHRKYLGGYSGSSEWLNKDALRALTKDLKHYEFLKVCSDALTCISRSETWTYFCGSLHPYS